VGLYQGKMFGAEGIVQEKSICLAHMTSWVLSLALRKQRQLKLENLHSKENNELAESICRMGGNICKQWIWQGVDIKKIEGTTKPHYR
jgi:hypothetical protein